MHNIGRGKMTAIMNSWLEHGLRPRQKASFTASNTTSRVDVEIVVRFLLRYAEDNDIFQGISVMISSFSPICRDEERGVGTVPQGGIQQ